MFKRFWSEYGSKLNEILNQETSISNSLWNTVIPGEKEIADIERGDLEYDAIQTIRDLEQYID